MVIRRKYDKVEEAFGPQGWREEAHVLYRQRKSVMFVMALMIVLAAFWTSFWAFAVFFGVMAAYSLWVGVRIGFICGLSFAAWFLTLRQWPLWYFHHKTLGQIIALWCLSTLFFLVVWKADATTQLRVHRDEERG